MTAGAIAAAAGAAAGARGQGSSFTCQDRICSWQYTHTENLGHASVSYYTVTGFKLLTVVPEKLFKMYWCLICARISWPGMMGCTITNRRVLLKFALQFGRWKWPFAYSEACKSLAVVGDCLQSRHPATFETLSSGAKTVSAD